VRTKLLTELCAAHRLIGQQRLTTDLVDVPSVRFAVEQCLRDLESGRHQAALPFAASRLGKQTIPINGLVWMGDKAHHEDSGSASRSTGGFTTVKMKIGAIGIDDELELFRSPCEREYSAAMTSPCAWMRTVPSLLRTR
jgi:L-alanine-DL-glutamate epimerase-like enolase superfamily enzyme